MLASAESFDDQQPRQLYFKSRRLIKGQVPLICGNYTYSLRGGKKIKKCKNCLFRLFLEAIPTLPTAFYHGKHYFLVRYTREHIKIIVMKRTLVLSAFLALLVSCGGNPVTSVISSSDSSSESSFIPSSTVSILDTNSSETAKTAILVSSTSEEQSVEEAPLSPMDEPLVGKQYYLNHIGDIYGAWQQYRGKGATIAVIDVGFNPYHEDLTFADGTSKVLPQSANFSVRDGQVTTEIGVEKTVNMGESHGTFCAGVAAAGLNGKGVIGVAPEASLLLLKTDLRPKSIAAAFRYAADNGARIITISIGSYYDYGGDLIDDGSDLGTVFDDSVNYCYSKGVVICSAAGNGGLDNKPTEYTFPGCVDHIIGVGGLAANSSQEVWSGSSYNSSSAFQFADVFAPADQMVGCCHYEGKNYDSGWNGTSFASPIVAGIAALYFEKYPAKTNQDFENDLYRSCVALNSAVITNDQDGYGRVDVGKLLGIETKPSVKVRVKTSWSSCYAYIWNDVKLTEDKSWPGIVMEKVGATFVATIDAASFDSVIFTQGQDGPQSIDIALSSFYDEAIYDLTSATHYGKLLIGDYSR